MSLQTCWTMLIQCFWRVLILFVHNRLLTSTDILYIGNIFNTIIFSTKNHTFAPALSVEKDVIDNENLSTYTNSLPQTAGHNKSLGIIYLLPYTTILLLSSVLKIVSYPHGLPCFYRRPLPVQNNSDSELLAYSTTLLSIPKYSKTSSSSEFLSVMPTTTAELQSATTPMPNFFSYSSSKWIQSTDKKEKQVKITLPS